MIRSIAIVANSGQRILSVMKPSQTLYHIDYTRLVWIFPLLLDKVGCLTGEHGCWRQAVMKSTSQPSASDSSTTFEPLKAVIMPCCVWHSWASMVTSRGSSTPVVGACAFASALPRRGLATVAFDFPQRPDKMLQRCLVSSVCGVSCCSSVRSTIGVVR